jgi:hypothetical protein
MQQFSRLASALSSPAILIVVVWCSVLACVAIGPIDYPGQPSSTVLVMVAAGLALFILAHGAGAWCFRRWFARQANVSVPSLRGLKSVVIATSLIGIGGIGLIVFDRGVLSGINNSVYAELLRCAPGLVDVIEIRRTPLLYIGYLSFSFGFASLALFLLKGEEIRGWAAIVAQVSIVCPVGYALLYSGRMPILFAIILIGSVMLVRLRQGRPPLPRGHYLLLKTVVLVLLFAIYSSAIWSRRSNFCVLTSGVVHELEQRKAGRDAEHAEVRHEPEPNTQDPVGDRAKRPPPPPSIPAADVSKMVADAIRRASETRAPPKAVVAPAVNPIEALLVVMRESWNVRPRDYVLSAIDSGRLPSRATITFLSTYSYLTHGIRVAENTWRRREKLSPQWGLYEVGILSPILRVFRPHDQRVEDMKTQLRDAEIYGFFPTVWAAAYIDFGIVGGIIYILIWGFVGGWSSAGARRSTLVTPSLLLVFTLASIVLSPVQGPLGVANSVLVLFSMIVTGATIDLMRMRDHSRHASRKLKLDRSES